MKRLKTIVAIIIVLIAAIYIGDYAWLRYRASGNADGDAFGSVQLFYATQLKNGKVEVFYDQPVARECVHSIFPHLGYGPCWYEQRTTVTMR